MTYPSIDIYHTLKKMERNIEKIHKIKIVINSIDNND